MPTNPDAVTIVRDHVLFDPLQAQGATAPWQQLPDLPTAAELLNPIATTNDLPTFPVDRSFSSKAQYLEALYKILRFEAVEGLRFSINDFKSNLTMNDDQDTCIYTKVFVKGYLMTKLGPVCRVSFSTGRAGRKILWKQAKRLTPGRIVALSGDNFQTDCRVGIIAQRPIEGGLDQNPPTVDIFWRNSEESIIDPDHELVMIESRNGFYEAVRHALIGLQLAAGEKSIFDKYLLNLDNHDPLSQSITQNPLLSLSCLVTQLTSKQQRETSGNTDLERLVFQRTAEQYQRCDITRPLSSQEIQYHTSLDSSQLDALQRMVSKELAVVQGPPGTGKTYTSVQALKIMLENRQPGDAPVIIAAQTNHALDQLLIYCHYAGAKIMRVGGRTENEIIKERTAYNLRLSVGNSKSDGKYRSLERLRQKIVENFKTLVDGVFGDQGLLDPQALLDAGLINEAQLESLANDGWEGNDDEPAMEAWLGEERIESIRQPPEDLGFEEEEGVDEQGFELDPNFEDETADEDDRLQGVWIPLTSYYTGKTPHVPSWHARCAASLSHNDDLYQIPVPLRGGVYQILQSNLREASMAKFRGILHEAVAHAKEQKVNRWLRDLYVLEKHCIDIIGCTTTGLTKYRGFLAATGARVLLIEEAAETREANVTSALFPSLDQLVLVGDHQQLPPQCDIARLGNEPFNLNVSLFERMVRNRVPYTMLNRQRRMAPELRYIVQKYYPDLKDHPLVKDVANRPLIPGMGSRRTWFFTHEWPEETDADNSKINFEEAKMIVGFMTYLIKNGIKPSQITVLTYYRGQRKRISQLLRRDSLTLGTAYFNVATVDSYQGEENEIVLLSLVRSPPTPYDIKRVGFVESPNRATVAISRARRGFFMFGNKNNLFGATDRSFDTWAPVWNGFAEQQRVAMGKGLPLVCQNHNNEESTNEIWMKTPEDFIGNAGGCWIKCDSMLPCGHACILTCHVVPHETLPCLKSCIRVLPCGHKCSGLCADPCRCCEDCTQYKVVQAERQMAQLQLEVASSTSFPEPATEQKRDSSPEKWVEFSNNPQVYDDVIREARLRQMKEAQESRAPAASSQPLIELDTPPTSVNSPEKNNIRERFIPISNRDGVRVIEQKPDPRVQSPSTTLKTHSHNTGRRHKNGRQRRQGQETQNQNQTPNNKTPSQPLRAPRNQRKSGTRPNNQRNQAQVRMTSNQNNANVRRQEPFSSARNNPMFSTGGSSRPQTDIFASLAPGGGQAPVDSISLIGESDLGFEAEVLGIRRGHRTDQEVVDTGSLRERFRMEMPVATYAESLMSFGGDGADSPVKPAQPPENEKEEELLIDI
ncbi:hypothetical protein N8I77_010874 [Diaporthe amygdali]|uniref:Uncharacterized protein n=1 Tax=Phomopsis amygdali TaxID=1214568 RepID=A0AAD9SAU6_PHOAM|nr:hypothetical protein N8I77_010874 [Diaporthe amygdali]